MCIRDSPNEVFVQDWLLNYDRPCPGGWSWYFPNLTAIDCWENSAANPVSFSALTVQELPSVKLTGTVVGPSDEIVMTTASGQASAVAIPDPLLLSNKWTDAQWGIFGDAGGGEAIFYPGTTLTARTTLTNGTTLAPVCEPENFTGETNNLNLSTPAIGSHPPTLLSTQTNNPTTVQPSCAAARGIGDTHLKTFRNTLYDFQASGDFELATTGPGFTVENRQVSGAPAWPNAAVNQAVGARVGTSDVAVCTVPTRLMINNRPVHLANRGQTSLPGGGEVSLTGNVYLIQDPAGDSVTATVNTGNPDWIDASINLLHWPATLHGLLANARNSTNALQARNGTVLTAPFNFNAFYSLYGNSWRVPASQSLLSACGTKVTSGNPRNVFYSGNLPKKLAGTARAQCLAAGVHAAPLLDACTVDVAVLGRNAAQVYRNMPANVTGGKITPPTAG